jgi:diguanylate cyclase (GGDEF)-like protein
MVAPHAEKHVRNALSGDKQLIVRLHGGILVFLVPFGFRTSRYCLVGDGVREKSINLLEMEDLCKSEKNDIFEILDDLEKLPVSSLRDVEELAAGVVNIIADLFGKDKAPNLDKTKSQLNGIIHSLTQIDGAKTVEEVFILSGELLGTLFPAPKIAVALREEKDDAFSIKGIWGLQYSGTVSEEKLLLLFSSGKGNRKLRLEKGVNRFLVGVQAESVTLFPLEAQDVLFGAVIMLDADLSDMEESLVELVSNRIGAKLAQLKKDREHVQVQSLSSNLMSLTNTLLFAESKEELYRSTLEIAADLVGASRGSIMLVDKSEKSMQIGFCKGMNSQLAQTITVRVGEGIAGRVASSGLPLLVDDIEKDSRVGMRNRPRFRTKSLLCVPLKLKDKTIGVLNLADKENMGNFSRGDLNLLDSFAKLASLMIERNWTLERSSKLEQLSVTDHLTGLYNRRFMRNRLEEELNRSTRHGLKLTLIFVDLDYFKVYNDLSGHLAGDRALQKTAEILKASVRDMDTVVRYGGEEFCVILPDTAKTEATVVAERIRHEVERTAFPNEENLPSGRLTASFGISSFPDDGTTFSTLIHSADLALYKAKMEGRNRIVLGQPSMYHDVSKQQTNHYSSGQILADAKDNA